MDPNVHASGGLNPTIGAGGGGGDATPSGFGGGASVTHADTPLSPAGVSTAHASSTLTIVAPPAIPMHTATAGTVSGIASVASTASMGAVAVNSLTVNVRASPHLHPSGGGNSVVFATTPLPQPLTPAAGVGANDLPLSATTPMANGSGPFHASNHQHHMTAAAAAAGGSSNNLHLPPSPPGANTGTSLPPGVSGGGSTNNLHAAGTHAPLAIGYRASISDAGAAAAARRTAAGTAATGTGSATAAPPFSLFSPGGSCRIQPAPPLAGGAPNGKGPYQTDDGSTQRGRHNELPSLPSLTLLKDAKKLAEKSLAARQLLEWFQGPTPYSNWVIPGRFCVGAWPGEEYEGQQELKEMAYQTLVHSGINTFISLVDEKKQTYRHPTERYVSDSKLAACTFLEFKIVDMWISEHLDDWRAFLDTLCERITSSDCDAVTGQRQHVLYLHCWAGHGRTGMAVSYILAKLYGIPVAEALERCQALHDIRICPNPYMPGQVLSPSTVPQCRQVYHLMHQTEPWSCCTML